MVTTLAIRPAARSTVPWYSQIGLRSRGHCHHADAYHRVSVMAAWYRYIAACRATRSRTLIPWASTSGSQAAT